MESNKEEALKAKEIAEKRFAEKDFAGAKTYALKAKTLWPGLDGIAQMVATFEVYVASAAKFNGEVDYYSVLGLKPGADKYAVKRQYRKLAVLLHPDKNKCVGADGAFRLVSEAWTLLSDSAKRGTYDLKRNQGLASYPTQTNSSSLHTAGYTSHGNCFGPPTPQPRLDTFWTVCTSCKVQYEYLRKYLNKRLSCKNCRGIFVAVETGAAPVTGSFPYSPYTYVPNNGYGNHGSDGVSYAQSNSTYYMGNGVSGYHTGQGYEYVSNLSFQWNSPSGSSTVIVSPNGSAAPGNNAVYQPNGKLHKVRQRSGAIEKHSAVNTVADTGPHLSSGASGSSAPNVVKPDKRRKVSVGSEFRNGSSEAAAAKSSSEVKTVSDPKPNSSYELPAKRCSAMPAFDARKLLMDKARTEIRKRLEEMKQAAAAIAAAKAAAKLQAESGQSKMVPLSKPSKSGPVSIVVPDPDFHDFDKDRAEECFKPKQIWALYDEEDGMPRLYCLIRQIISVKPFKILISYLSSKTDAEFGSVNWIDRGFTKSCGHFRAWTSDVVEQVNIFSHLLSKEKAGRGGCVRVYPRSGDIWAVYRNWSPDWDRSTPAEVRHQYEMVEVIDDYSEELGVCVTPLVKLEGFKTVYQRDPNEGALRWIPRKEMLRFSHQVPSWSLKGENGNLPEGCWDLDPAATPDELLHADAGIEVEA